MAKEEIKLTEEEKELLETYDFWITKIEWEDETKYYTDFRWRPSKMTPKIVANLIKAFSNSLNDDEACLFCDISKNTLYRFIDRNPIFWHQKEILKQKPNIKAKLNKVAEINKGNSSESWWWLERKSRNEFSLKTETDVVSKSDDAKAEVYKKLAEKINTMKPDEINTALNDFLN